MLTDYVGRRPRSNSFSACALLGQLSAVTAEANSSVSALRHIETTKTTMSIGNPTSRLLVLVLLHTAATVFGGGSIDHKVFGSDFAVASYLPEWRYEGANWDEIAKHSTHLILFSLEPTPTGGIQALDRLPRPALLKQARAASSRYGAKLLLCFGGNGRSSGFSSMVRSKSAREKFVGSALALVDKYGFDGIDYNWEYPGQVDSKSWTMRSCILCAYISVTTDATCVTLRYAFGSGYKDEQQIELDYAGFAK